MNILATSCVAMMGLFPRVRREHNLSFPHLEVGVRVGSTHIGCYMEVENEMKEVGSGAE